MGVSMNNNFFDAMNGTTRTEEPVYTLKTEVEEPKEGIESLRPEIMDIDHTERLLNWIYRELYSGKLNWSSTRRANYKKYVQRFESANPRSIRSRDNVIDMIGDMNSSGLIDAGISYKLALGITLY